MQVNRPPSGIPGSSPPQFLSALSTIIEGISTLLTQMPPGGGLNMGPGTDTVNFKNKSNIFADTLPPTPSKTNNKYAPASDASGASGAAGASGAYNVEGASGASGSSGASGAYDVKGASGASGSEGSSGAEGASGSSGASGASGESGYAEMMNKALRANGATEELLKAYNDQYELLGLSPKGAPGTPPAGGTPSAPGTPPKGEAPGTPGTPPKGEAPGAPGTPPKGGAPGTPGTQPKGEAPGAPGTPPKGGAPGTPGTQPTGGAPGTNKPPEGIDGPKGDGGSAPDTPATPGQPGQVKPGDQHAYDDLIEKAGQKYGVDPLLIKAVMRQESDFDPGATSAADARGLMQVIPTTQAETGVTGDLYQPSVSINAGAAYISKMLEASGGDVHRALLAYNAGPNAAKDGAIPAGQDHPAGVYAAKVEGWYQDLKTKGEVNTTLGANPGG